MYSAKKFIADESVAEAAEQRALVVFSRRSSGGALLDCSVRQMKVLERRTSGDLSSARSAAIARGANIGHATRRQRSELVQHGESAERKLRDAPAASAKKVIRGWSSHCSVVATVRVRTPSEPNKALEPTCLLGLRFRILLLRSTGPRRSKSLARPQPHVAHL